MRVRAVFVALGLLGAACQAQHDLPTLQQREEVVDETGLCSPPIAAAAASKRGCASSDPRDGPDADTASLCAREMTLPKSNSAQAMNGFMRKETPKVEQIVWRHEEGIDMNTAKMRDFQLIPFGLATSHLTGCTTLVIISRNGVYATHWWETISFSTHLKKWGRKGETKADVFMRTVTRAMKNGRTKDKVVVHDKLNAAEFRDPSVRAYLVRPRGGLPNRQGVIVDDIYRAHWDSIRETVETLIPELKIGDRYREIPYERQTFDNRLLDTTARGRVLFKFDPDHNGKNKAALWVERVQYHDDEW